MDGSAPVAVVLGTGRGVSADVRDALQAAGTVVRLVAEAELLSTRRPERPALLVLDDDRSREERAATLVRLRAHPVLHAVPVIVVTSDCGIDSFGGAIARGAAVVLRKPLDPEELRAAAARLLEWRGEAVKRDPRTKPRRPLILACDVTVAGQPAARALIVDVSSSGCRLEMGEPVRAGAAVSVVPRACEDSTGIALGGTVRWCRGREGGGYQAAVRWSGTTALFARRLFGLGAAA